MTADEPALARARRLREIASSAAAASAEYLLPAFRSPMLVQHKGSAHDVVTEHDVASEAIIREHILREEPDSTVLGEEGGAVGTGRVVWHVDPIDGTVNFANGIAFWCVSVAAAVDGEVVAGVVLDPVGGHEFSADLEGAWLDGRRLGPRASATEIGAAVISTFPAAVDLASHGSAALDATRSLLESFGTVRAMGSGALGLVHVAAGWADATFDLHTHPWDVAAGSLIVRRAGGRYVGFVDGVPDEDPRSLHLAPSYYAVGPGADYPTLDGVVRGLSSGRLPLPAS